MKITLRRKVVLAFSVFMLVGGLLWLLDYYKYDILNRKLQIIEQKDTLLNTILEARRYEKNYFLSSNVDSLKTALSYIHKAEKIMRYIIDTYAKYTLTANLGQRINELQLYENALKEMLAFYGEDGTLKLDRDVIENLSEHQEKTSSFGRTVTAEVERMVKEERRYIKKLIKESRLYHFIALSGIFILCIFAVLFLIFSVNRPLKTIENAIHKIAVGDYANIPSLGTGDEFESLVTSLNDMITELNRRSEQLIQAKKLASLGTLTSGVAHELNNPLNNISTSVQILLEEIEDPDLEYKKQLLTETEKQIDRARDIVRALLEFSRERTFSLKQVHLKSLVDNTIRLIKGELPANVELKVEMPDDIQGTMDGRRIQQVLLNLILNGLQAMEDGGILKIKARKMEDQGIFCIQVQDTGKGISEEDFPKIFDPFFTTKDMTGSSRSGPPSHSVIEQPGTGLGLSICHGIVERHGGRIEVQSSLGEGTTFSVCLPLATENNGTD
jgi:two-component system, NtrC family, sensor kinase